MSRKLRLAESLRRLVSEILARDVRDVRLDGAMVSVARVELNEDLSVATVWVSILGARVDPAAVMVALASAAAFVRRGVSKTLKLRQAPELRFVHDTSPEFGIRLRSIILEDERKAQEANQRGADNPQSTHDAANPDAGPPEDAA